MRSTKDRVRPGKRGDVDAVRVLIADKNAHFRETVRRVVERYSNCLVVAEASGLTEAVAYAAQVSPNMVLLDVGLVARDGLSDLKRLPQLLPAARVVILLSDYSPDYRAAVQSQGGYLCAAKDRIEEELAWIIGGAGAAVGA